LLDIGLCLRLLSADRYEVSRNKSANQVFSVHIRELPKLRTAVEKVVNFWSDQKMPLLLATQRSQRGAFQELPVPQRPHQT
jgi:hypothetical protein